MTFSQIAHDDALRRQLAAEFARRRYLIRFASNATSSDFLDMAEADETMRADNDSLSESLDLAWHVIWIEVDMLATGALPSEL